MKKIVVSILAVVFFVAGGSAVFAGNAGEGAKIFKKKCGACHLETDKKKVGPGMKGVFGRESEVAGKMDEEGLHKWIKDPKSVNPKSKMAKLFKAKLKDEEIDDVIAYIKTLK